MQRIVRLFVHIIWCMLIFGTGAVRAAEPNPVAGEELKTENPVSSTGTLVPDDTPQVQELTTPSAEQTFVPSSAFGVPLAFTLRGGVSLGAFKAGYIYYIAEALKKKSQPV